MSECEDKKESCVCNSDKLRSSIIERVRNNYEQLYFDEPFDFFFNFIESNPYRALRTSFQYLYDSILYFEKNEKEIKGYDQSISTYNVFSDPFTQGEKEIFGLENVLASLVREIKSTAKMGQPRILLLNGPEGTAKTTIFDLLFKAEEEYSKTDEGELLRFEWDINGERIPCMLNENPVLLIPAEFRLGYIKRLIGNEKDLARVNKKLLHNSPCTNCQTIYDKLLEKYEGDWEKVMSHVRIKRLVLKENQGLVRIMEAHNIHGHSKKISPKALQDLGTQFNYLLGPFANANRGLVHFQDIFKQKIDLDPLGNVVQEGKVSFGPISEDMDAVLLMTSNLEDYELMRERKLSKSFRDRMQRINVPYVLKLDDEIKIYERHLKETHPTSHVAPFTVDVVALWALMTRLSFPTLESESKAEEILTGNQVSLFEDLTPMQKIQIYNGLEGFELTAFNETERKLINPIFRRLLKESPNKEIGYDWPEGMFGISPRKIQDIFKSILKVKGCLSPVDIFNQLENILEYREEEFEFLETETKLLDKVLEFLSEIGGGNASYVMELRSKGYHSPKIALDYAKEYYEEKIRDQVGFALVGMSEKEVDDMVFNYFVAVERLFSKKTEREGTEEVDNHHLVEVENILDEWQEEIKILSEADKMEFRRDIYSEYLTFSNENPGVPLDKINFREVLPHLYLLIKVSQFDLYKHELDFANLKKGFQRFGSESFNKLDENLQKKVNQVIFTLENSANYCKECARNTVLYALENEILGEIDWDLPPLDFSGLAPLGDLAEKQNDEVDE